MRYIYSFLIILTALNAAAQCSAPTAITIAIKGDEKMVVVGGGALLGASPTLPAYSIQNGNMNQSLVYALGNFIGGISPDNQLKISISTYPGNGSTDFFPGPLTDGTAETSLDQCLLYDAVWFYNRAQVERHAAYFQCIADPNCDDFPLGYTIPSSFYDYPAHGDLSFGMPEYLFAFYDHDLDGTYNPDHGDCPGFTGLPGIDDCCKGLKGDVCALTIANDNGNVGGSGGESIGVELQKMVYYFNSPALDNTVLMRTNWINRGTQTLSDTYLAYFIDGDIGASTDDQYGADPERDLFFFYNGDENDSQFGNGGNIPVAGFKLLSGAPMDDDDIDNDGDGYVDNELIGAVHSVSSDILGQLPNTAQGYYNLMQGLYSNGVAFNEGGEPVDFHQVGYPTGSEGYIPSDVRQIVSTGGFTLQPGDDFCTEGAFLYKMGETDVLSAFEGFPQKADSVQMHFDECFGCVPPAVHMFSEYINGGYAFMNFSLADQYVWDFGDGTTSNLKFPQHVYDEAGEYTVTLTVTNACGTATGSIVLNAVVGIDEDELADVSIFPNPTNSELNIRYEGTGAQMVRLYTSTGQIALEQTVLGGSTVLNVSGFTNGFYILEITQADGTSMNQRVVIQD